MPGLLIAALLLLPYWPGGTSRWSTEPVYQPQVPVISEFRGTDRYRRSLAEARREWSDCGPLRLVASDETPFTPGTITIVRGDETGIARGAWVTEGGYGVVFLPPERWARGVRVIEHEMGHALGFGHTKRDSVMGAAANVTSLDCQGLRAYY